MVSNLNANGLRIKILRVSHAVNAGNRCHDQHISSAGQQGRSSRKTELFDFIVDAQVFFNVGIAGRDVGFGLVIVVVGHEVFYGILRKELPEFSIQLCCQGFVVAQYQGGFLHLFHHIGHGKGFSCSGSSQERLKGDSGLNALGDFCNSHGLIAQRLIRRF